MKELGITINKILKEWLQPKGEGDIVFTDDTAITAVTHEIAEACHKEYDELLRQRDELLAACKEFVRKVECGEARSVRSYAQMKAAIKNTDG